MINIASETVVSLTEAARRLPARRQGKRPNVATLYRWAQSGCRGVRLEVVQVGGTKCTSLEALQRFVDQLGNSAGADPGPARRTPRQRERAADQAMAKLRKLGV